MESTEFKAMIEIAVKTIEEETEEAKEELKKRKEEWRKALDETDIIRMSELDEMKEYLYGQLTGLASAKGVLQAIQDNIQNTRDYREA